MTKITQTAAARTVERIVKGGTLAVLFEAIRRRNPNGVVNAALVFPATYLPRAAERLFDVEFRPWQRAYVGIAMLAHAVGFLGPYDDTWWWDHLTHVLSATLLGGAVHVVAHRRDRDSTRDVLAAIVGGGILWECLEYAVHGLSNRLGVEPALVYYGLDDTLGDLAFNLVGGLLVLAFGDSLLRNFTENDD